MTTLTAMGRIAFAILLVLAYGGLSEHVAFAQKRGGVENLASDAAQAYHRGDYQRAADLLERAYRIQPLSALLYNLGKAYDKLGAEDKAVDCYTRYSTADDADPKLRQKAESRLAALTRERKPEPSKGVEPQPKVEPQPVEPQPRVEPPKMEPQPAPPTPQPKPVDREARARSRDRGLAVGLVSLGGAALVSAIGLSVSALELHGQFTRSADENEKRSLRDRAQTQALAADLLYAAGAVSVGVSAYFFYRGWRRTPKVSLAPLISPTVAGALAEGRF